MSFIHSLRIKPMLPWLFAGLIIGLILALIFIVAGIFTRNGNQQINPPTPVLTVIPAPSETPTPRPSNTPEVALSTITPTSAPAVPGEIAQGILVEISGTGGDNLRLRASPGLNAAIAFLGVESEVFEVLEGPEEVDGYQWWYLQNPYNSTKTGWAVSVYLRPITSP